MKDPYVQLAFNVPIDRLFTYLVPEELHIEPGMRLRAPFGRRSLVGYAISTSAELPADLASDTKIQLKPIAGVLDEEPIFNRTQVDLAKWMARMYFSNLGECLATMIPSAKRERDLLAGEEEDYSAVPLELSAEQDAAVAALMAERQGLHYLAGITGSGKTEVFLQAARSTLDEGRSVIYLVPEIALTTQVVSHIRKRFGGEAAVLHSRLTPSQRLKEWRRILAGGARIVVGARSAVFAPVRDLGLIILDEEHETSYKSQTSPRYHARQVAMRRASTEGARLVMGSATPSVEAGHLIAEGRLQSHRLSRRLAGGTLPEIRVVNLRGQEGSLSRELVEEMVETKRLGKQTILFLNRRGFGYFFHCRTCGADAKCLHCSASLTFHKAIDLMVCHYCGYKTRPLAECSACGSLDVGYSGFGTEQIEEEVRGRFPDWTIRRLDTDAVQKKGVLEETLAEFRAGRIDVLLGTQMIAKGLNFPGVRLVGLVMADSGLHMPDFRSAERTFSLITQVSGRAGRFSPDGLVIVQSLNPENPAIRLASEGKTEQFFQEELSTRRALGFPPFARLIRLLVRSRSQSSGLKAASELRRRLDLSVQAVASAGGDSKDSAVEVLGPAEAPIGKIAGNYRIHILASGRDFSSLHSVVSRSVRDFDIPSGSYLEIDVDPVQLM